jgi:hypothetical protein
MSESARETKPFRVEVEIDAERRLGGPDRSRGDPPLVRVG